MASAIQRMLGKKKNDESQPPVTPVAKFADNENLTIIKKDKRQSSSRIKLAQNRELVKLPPLKDASVSTTNYKTIIVIIFSER